ncbi:glycosyltransferase family 4 protein [Noviherbaspirillum cavernae]|nr:glycosyltransferase family 4 protein [Noviherbaspirillum cavernae]
MTSVHPWDDVRIFHKECRSLARAGFDVHLVACAPRTICVDGVNVHAVPKAQGGRLHRMLATAWRVYQTARALNADVYHFHDPELIPYGLLLKWQGRKVVYDVHEDVPRDILSKHWITPRLRRRLSQAFEWVEDFAAKRFASVVAATPFIAQRFARVNPSSVDVNNYPAEFAELARQGCADKAGSRNLCYIGGIGTIRGAFEMVRALEFVDARLIMAGPFQSTAIEEELRSLPGWKKVDYRGVVDREGVARILAESRIGLVLLHPVINYLDSLPVKMFEYMAAGLPVVASDFPYWRSLLADAGAGVCVDPLDPRAIARCIETLLERPDEAVRMGDAGRRAVSDRYRWDHESDKLIALYGHLAAR